MEVLYDSCCGLDVHAKTVVACRINRGTKEIRMFSTMTDELLQLADWLLAAERQRVRRIPTTNLMAYEAYLQGHRFYQQYIPEFNLKARQLYERAVELDPEYAEVYSEIGMTYWAEWFLWGGDRTLLDRAVTYAQRTIALESSLSVGHLSLGRTQTAPTA